MRKRNGGGVWAMRRKAAESPAAVAARRAARRLAMFSSTSLGTIRFQRTVTEVSAVTALGWACDWSALRAGLARRRERASNRRAIRMVASVWEQGFVEVLRLA